MAIPLTTGTISGIIALAGLICTMVFGILMKKGAIYFKLHRIFSIITVISALIHGYIMLSRFV